MIFTRTNIGNHLTDLTLINKAQPLTRYIQNGRDCAKIKGCSPLQHSNGLIGLKPAIAHICIYPSVVRKLMTSIKLKRKHYIINRIHFSNQKTTAPCLTFFTSDSLT